MIDLVRDVGLKPFIGHTHSKHHGGANEVYHWYQVILCVCGRGCGCVGGRGCGCVGGMCVCVLTPTQLIQTLLFDHSSLCYTNTAFF